MYPINTSYNLEVIGGLEYTNLKHYFVDVYNSNTSCNWY